MTDISKNSHRSIHSLQDAKTLYRQPDASQTGKLGVEVELPLYRAAGQEIEIPEAPVMQTIADNLKAKGYAPNMEASGVLEYASDAVRLAELPALVERMDRDLRAFEGEAEAQGLRRAPYPVLPTATMQEAIAKMCDRERLRVGIKALLEVSPRAAGAVPLLTSGVQVSFSPLDMEALFRMTKRAYGLTPLLYAAMNADSGFVENDSIPLRHHARGTYYEGYGKAAGISEAYLTATSAEHFIENHIQQVIETPMYMACIDDTPMPSTRQNVFRFKNLERRDKTQTNYEMAESFLYHDVKICNLRDAQGETIGKRLEVRAADCGFDQPLMTPLLIAPLVEQGGTAEAFEKLLKDFGFTGEPRRDAPLLVESRQHAVHHLGRYMKVPFGTRSLPLFAQEVSRILADHYQDKKLPIMAHGALSQLQHILQTGKSDAFLTAQNSPSLDALKRSMILRAERSCQPCPLRHRVG